MAIALVPSHESSATARFHGVAIVVGLEPSNQMLLLPVRLYLHSQLLQELSFPFDMDDWACIVLSCAKKVVHHRENNHDAKHNQPVVHVHSAREHDSSALCLLTTLDNSA